jgi:ABC-type transport system substrate-binding protein
MITLADIEAAERLTSLRTSEMHLINDIPADRIAEIKGDPKFQVVSWFPLNWDFVNLNHEFEPFKDPRVRLAFDLASTRRNCSRARSGAKAGRRRRRASRPRVPTTAR